MTNIRSRSATSRETDGILQGPHWGSLKDAKSQDLAGMSEESLDELLNDVGVTSIPLKLRAEILSSGLNVALQRWPKLAADT